MGDVPILAAFDEAFVQIGADDAFIELCAADILHAVKGVLVVVVFDKTKAAGSLLKAIKTHD